MRFRDWERPADPGTATVAPARCPFCESTRIQTTGDAGSNATYWRCDACGEIWNPMRQARPIRHRGW